MSLDMAFAQEERELQRVRARKKALRQLQDGAFESPAASLAELRLLWQGLDENFQRAISARTLLDDTFSFSRILGENTTYDELERRLYDLPPEVFRVRAADARERINYSTKDTQLAQAYLESRYRRSWMKQSPSLSAVQQFYAGLHDISVSIGVLSPRVSSQPEILSLLSDQFMALDNAPTLTSICRSWLELLPASQENVLTQLLWFTLMPVLLMRSGYVSFGAISFGRGFSYLTLYNEPSPEARLVYLAGALSRAARDGATRIRAVESQITKWRDKLRGSPKGVCHDALPWLITRGRIRAVDLTRQLGCHRSHSQRAIDYLVRQNILTCVTDQKRNKIYSPVFDINDLRR